MRTTLSILLALVLGSLFLTRLEARPVKVWTYQELLEAADVVLMVEAVSAKATDDKAEDQRLQKLAVPFQTELKVLLTFKGKVTTDTVQLVHYQMRKDVTIASGGPNLVTFRTEGRKNVRLQFDGGIETRDREGRPQYLVFLKRRADGRYAPVTGQFDPDQSVREFQPDRYATALGAGRLPVGADPWLGTYTVYERGAGDGVYRLSKRAKMITISKDGELYQVDYFSNKVERVRFKGSGNTLQNTTKPAPYLEAETQGGQRVVRFQFSFHTLYLLQGPPPGDWKLAP